VEIAVLHFGQMSREDIIDQQEQVKSLIIEDMARTINLLAESTFRDIEDFGPTDPLHRVWILESLGDDPQTLGPYPIIFMSKGKAPSSLEWLGGERVSLPDFDFDIAQGAVAKHSVIHKFGSRVVGSTSEVPADVWDGPREEYPWPTSGVPMFISSDNVADTGIPIRIQGLDSNLDVQIFSVSLDGQTKVPLESIGGETWRRIHRAFVNGGTEVQGTIYLYADGGITAGVPDNLNKVGAVINPEHQQTQMTMFTIPNEYTGYLRNWAASVNRATTVGVKEADLLLQVREPGKVFRTQEFFTPNNQGTGIAQIEYKPPRKLIAGTDIRVRVSATSTNNTEVSSFYDLILVQD